MVYFKVPHVVKSFSHHYLSHLRSKISDFCFIFQDFARRKEFYHFEFWIFLYYYIQHSSSWFSCRKQNRYEKIWTKPQFLVDSGASPLKWPFKTHMRVFSLGLFWILFILTLILSHPKLKTHILAMGGPNYRVGGFEGRFLE